MSSLRCGTIALWLALAGSARAQDAGVAAPAASEDPDAPRPGLEATGTAPVADDVVRARQRALTDAMQRTLEQAVIQAAPEARGRLYIVSGHARDYVTSYRVLEEGESGGQFSLRISAQIDTPRLLHDLQPAGRSAGPRAAPVKRATVLLCSALPAATSPGQGALEEAALGQLREELATLAQVAPSAACPRDGEWPRALTRATAAVVLSELTVIEAPSAIRGTTPPLQGTALRAGLVLRAPGDAPAGPAVYTAEAFGFGETVEAAQRAAVQQAAQRALTQMTPRLRQLLPAAAAAEGSNAVQVTLEGIESYGDYQRLLRTLAALPDVRSVEPRRFSSRGSQATILVQTQSGAAAVAAQLGRTPIAGLQVQVMAPQGNNLRVLVAPERLVPRP